VSVPRNDGYKWVLSTHGALHYLTPATTHALTSRAYFPHLISAPFHSGLIVVFATSAALSALAALASLMQGRRLPAASTIEGAIA
jgi:hypothetical protein